MSKILDASCSASGQVRAEGYLVSTAKILSEGKQASTGTLLMDGEKQTYITSNASDIKTTLEKVANALDQIANALTSIDAKPTGGTGSAPTPVASGQVSQIQALKAELDTLKGALK